jgi:hypothetical protein
MGKAIPPSACKSIGKGYLAHERNHDPHILGDPQQENTWVLQASFDVRNREPRPGGNADRSEWVRAFMVVFIPVKGAVHPSLFVLSQLSAGNARDSAALAQANGYHHQIE